MASEDDEPKRDATKPADKPDKVDNTGALVKLGLGVTALVAIAVVAVVFLKADDEPPTLTDQDAGMEACLQLATLESKKANAELGTKMDAIVDELAIKRDSSVTTVNDPALRAQVIEACQKRYGITSWVRVTVEDEKQRPIEGAIVQISGDNGGQCSTLSNGGCELAVGEFAAGTTKTVRADFDDRVAKLDVDEAKLRAGVTLTLAPPAPRCTISFIADDGSRVTDVRDIAVVVGTTRPEVTFADGEASFECDGLSGEIQITAVTPKQQQLQWVETLAPSLSLPWGDGGATCQVTFLDGNMPVANLRKVEVVMSGSTRPIEARERGDAKGSFEFRCPTLGPDEKGIGRYVAQREDGERRSFEFNGFEPIHDQVWDIEELGGNGGGGGGGSSSCPARVVEQLRGELTGQGKCSGSMTITIDASGRVVGGLLDGQQVSGGKSCKAKVTCAS